MMIYFITHLSLSLLVKEILKLVNIWRSYVQNGDVSCAPFALHFCPQRCWSRQISWITCVLWTETVTNRWYVNRQINVSLDLLTDWLTPSVTDDKLLIMYGILLRQLFFVAAVVYCGSWDFLYGRCEQLFVSELNNAYFSRHLF